MPRAKKDSLYSFEPDPCVPIIYFVSFFVLMILILYRLLISVAGDSSVGKTSILNILHGDPFETDTSTEEWDIVRCIIFASIISSHHEFGELNRKR